MVSGSLTAMRFDELPLPGTGALSAFLAGAGCSYNLPKAKTVTDALVDAVIDGLHEVDPRLRDLLKDNVRFEFFFQTIRDVLQIELRCLEQIYGDPPRGIKPTRYHHWFAKALSFGHSVITTNFDLLVETAYADLDGSPRELRVLKADADLWTNPLTGPTLMKVHGSADDLGSLCATFDTVTSKDLQKHDAVTEVLKERSLCVLGNGGWYDDVLQLLFDTEARDQYLFWFDHADHGLICQSFSEIVATPAAFSDRPAHILERLVKSRRRAPERVFLIKGNTEAALKTFLPRLGVPTEIDSTNVHTWRNKRAVRRVEARVPNVIRDWLATLPGATSLHRRLVCIDLAYVYGVVESVDLKGLAKAVEAQLTADKKHQCIGLPRVAKALYNDAEDEHEYERVESVCEEAIAACRLLPHEPSVLASLLDAYGWKAEAQRNLDHFAQAEQTCMEARQAHRGLARRGLGRNSKLVRRAVGALLNSEGEAQLTSGAFARAGRTFRRAAELYRNAGDLIWLLYARIGRADAVRLSGNLTEAEREYAEIELDIHLTGLVAYLRDWLLLPRIDLWRLAAARGAWFGTWADWQPQVEGVQSEITDDAARERAALTAVELRWMGLGLGRPTASRAERKEIKSEYRRLAKKTEEDLDLDLALSYAEFLKFGSDKDRVEAEDRTTLVLKEARRRKLPLLALWAELELLDLHRLGGRRCDFRRVSQRCHELGYLPGLVYVQLLKKAGGVSVRTLPEVTRFIQLTRWSEAAEILADRRALPAGRGVRLAFPGLFTLY